MQWFKVCGTADRGRVRIDTEVLAETPDEAKQEALWIAGTGAVWPEPPVVVAVPDEEEDQ